MSFTAKTTVTGAEIIVKDKGDGVFTVTQKASKLAPAPFLEDDYAQISFGPWSYGPLTVSGYVDTSNYAFKVTASILGIDIGTFTGDLQQGVKININLLAATGYVQFYLQNGNQLWVKVHLSVLFDGTYDTDKEIFSW